MIKPKSVDYNWGHVRARKGGRNRRGETCFLSRCQVEWEQFSGSMLKHGRQLFRAVKSIKKCLFSWLVPCVCVSLDVFAGRESSHTKASTVKTTTTTTTSRPLADVESACHHERHDSTVALDGH